MANTDLENGATLPLKRSKTWSTFLASGMTRNSTTRSEESDESEKSETQRALTDEERKQQDALILFLVDHEIIKGVLAKSCSWYCKYLRSKFELHWTLLAAALIGLDDASATSKSGDLVVVYSFLHTVAKLLKSSPDLALVTIVDELDNNNLVKSQLDEERAVPNQAVFAAVGWLTLLYEAASHPNPNKLEVKSTSTSMSGDQSSLQTLKYFHYKQGFDNVDKPLYRLLGKFGDLLPEAPPSLPTRRASDTIKVQSVCFSALQGLTDLRIEWVTSLALHLELDSSRKTLKLFQFPSFCRIMFAGEGCNVLSRIVNDQAACYSEDVTEPDVPIEDFFAEILLSYRVIFGQDERSWKAFSHLVPAKDDNTPTPTTDSVEKLDWDCDPLLFTLCGKDAETAAAREVYEDIEARESRSCYVPREDFKFLGRRLLALQDFIDNHQPRNIRELLNDRRDVAAWWTLWNNQLLIIFASVTIFLMILSLIFQVWQVQLARQQLSQGST